MAYREAGQKWQQKRREYNRAITDLTPEPDRTGVFSGHVMSTPGRRYYFWVLGWKIDSKAHRQHQPPFALKSVVQRTVRQLRKV